MYEDGTSVERLEEAKREAIKHAVRRAEREGKSSPDPCSDSELGESIEQMWDDELGGEG